MSQMCPNCSFDNPSTTRVCVQCKTPLRNLLGKDILLGQRYKLASVLGCGAMGAVYLADDLRLKGRRCAIKENLPDPGAPVNVQNRAREQFLAEASVLARLDHPNLPKVSDYFIFDDREYLVMDYVEGDDLESRLERTRQPLEEKSVVLWADQVLDALNYLHNQRPQPIIHRDIKPANLRVDLYNRVKLVDFGLVKLFDADSPETKAELRGIGTPAYAPLEQFAGSDEHTDSRSDIYSLGATLYHLLTNIPPVEVHRRLLKPESLVKPRALNPALSENTELVILRAIAIYPDERYQSADEMRQALIDSTETRASASPKTAKAKKGSMLPILLGAAGLALVLALLGIAAYVLLGTGAFGVAQKPPAGAQALQPETTPILVPTATPTASPSPTRVIQENTPAPSATPSPLPATATNTPLPSPSPAPVAAQPRGVPPASLSGTIAYPVYNGTSYDLYFAQADGSGSRLFRANASQPAFSPDGLRIAFHSWSRDSRGLVASDLNGGGALVANFVEDQLPTWTPDGSQILLLSRRTGSRKSELYLVDSRADRGPASYVGEGEYPTIGAGGQVVFKGWGNTGDGLRLASFPLADIESVTDSNQDTAPALSPDGSQIAFMSRRDDDWELYIVNADGSNLQRLTNSPGRDGLPVWSPDGRVIAFVSERGGQWAMWATTPAGSEPQQLFEMQGSPDGFVGNDNYASRGWAEERLSWTP
ncbi:MAG: Protein TolB [Anaerolineae bacterium]|nr:Protein TolB [Anaerolineae bacterium]